MLFDFGFGENLGGNVQSDLLIDNDTQSVTLFVNNVLHDMEHLLDSRQYSALNDVLTETINEYSISSEDIILDVDYEQLNNDLINNFIDNKRLVGLSPRTLDQYSLTLKLFTRHIGKGLDTVKGEDVREWLDYLMVNRGTGKVTLDNYRRYLNSFYNWCVKEGLIYKNPLLKVERLKTSKKVKKPFTSEEIWRLNEACNDIRNKAILNLLISSGMRIGELVQLNKADMNMERCTVYVIGKGNKERECFFNTTTKMYLQEYLSSRKDDNPSLFVSHNKPYSRLGISGAERMLRDLGKEANVRNVHPHRFRRTFATTLLRKDVPIEQIRILLGHEQLATTQLYVSHDDEELKFNHQRYVN